MKHTRLALLLACAAGAVDSASAGPALDAARAHFAAIGAGERAAGAVHEQLEDPA